MLFHNLCVLRTALAGTIALTALTGLLSPAHSAGFAARYDLSGTALPAGVSVVNITVDGRPPRYPETFVNDMDGDGVPEFIAFPGGFSAGRCRPLLIALSTVREDDNIDSSDTRYITVADANGIVSDDSYCTDIETFETVGDMDGDGFADFALYSQGTHVLQGLHDASGEIRLADLDGSNGFMIEGALLRRSVGDLDGDGHDELALTQYDPDLSNHGAEYIVRGRAGPRKKVIDPESDTDDDLLATLFDS